MTTEEPPLLVASLLGHAQVEMAILCLGSLVQGSAEPLALRLHDDGSLTDEDRERLAAALDNPLFVARPDADERAAGILAGRPALAAFRRRNPLAMKLVDIVLYAGDTLAYCDADVLFLRPFNRLFPPGEPAAVFMADRQNAYSVRSWHLLQDRLGDRRLRLPRCVNSGILRFPTAAWDPDLLDWYLAQPNFGFAPVWMEQTAWALLGGAAGCRLFDPMQIAIPEPGEIPAEGAPDDRIALHFVSPVRSVLPNWAARAVSRGDPRPPVAVRQVPAGNCGFLGLVATEGRRALGRLTGR
jgi:hypothetical protein